MSRNSGERICLFGGTFDPVHLGHLIIARAVLEAAGLDRMVFIPSARPPHKGGDMMFDAAARFAMLERAVGSDPQFSVSGIEMRRPGPSFTIDTIREFKTLAPGAGLSFLVGRDNLAELPSWRDPEAILAECAVLVAERSCDDRAVPAWVLERVRPVRVPIIEISSSDIRARIRAGKSIRHLVPETVETMIREMNPAGK